MRLRKHNSEQSSRCSCRRWPQTAVAANDAGSSGLFWYDQAIRRGHLEQGSSLGSEELYSSSVGFCLFWSEDAPYGAAVGSMMGDEMRRTRYVDIGVAHSMSLTRHLGTDTAVSQTRGASVKRSPRIEMPGVVFLGLVWLHFDYTPQAVSRDAMPHCFWRLPSNSPNTVPT